MADLATKAKPANGSGIIATDKPTYQMSDQANQIQKQIQDNQKKLDTLNQQQKQAYNQGFTFGDVQNIGPVSKARGDLRGAIDEASDYQKTLKKQLDDQVAQDKKQFEVQDQFSKLQGQQQSAADQFRANFPSIVENTMAPLRSQARRAIASGVNNNKASFNQRGLLYSGLRSGANADVAADVNNQLNDARAQVNQNAADTQMALDQAPIQTALAGSALQGQQAAFNNDFTNNILNALMNKSEQNTALTGNLLGAGGQLLGTVAGGLINPGKNPAGTNVASNNPLYSPIQLPLGSGGGKYSLFG